MNTTIISGGIFLITYALIVAERIPRTISALLGGVTMIVKIPLRNAMTNLHGSYECRLLLQADSEPPISSDNIQNTIELDPAVPSSQQVFVVQGDIHRTPY